MRIKDEEKIPKIYNAAIRIINRDGFDGCSMSKIAKEAGIAPATIYLYFENKEDMLNKLFIHVKHGIGNSYFSANNNLVPTKETFRQIWFNHYNYILNNLEEYIFIQNFSNSPLLQKIDLQEKADYCPVFESLALTSKNEGVLLPLKNDLIYSMLFAPMSYMVKKAIAENIELTNDELNQIFETSWKGISI